MVPLFLALSIPPLYAYQALLLTSMLRTVVHCKYLFSDQNMVELKLRFKNKNFMYAVFDIKRVVR